MFDLLWHNAEDLRALPLTERKKRLRAVVPRHSGSILYVQQVATHGVALFNEVCANDLEGVVGKWANGTYVSDGQRTSWVKIKNATYFSSKIQAGSSKGCGMRTRGMGHT